MTDTSEAKRHVREEAERVMAERMAAVEDLADAVAQRVDLEQKLSEAKKEEKRKMAAAEKSGWTRAEVAKFAKPRKSTARKSSGPTDESSTRPAHEITSDELLNEQ